MNFHFISINGLNDSNGARICWFAIGSLLLDCSKDGSSEGQQTEIFIGPSNITLLETHKTIAHIMMKETDLSASCYILIPMVWFTDSPMLMYILNNTQFLSKSLLSRKSKVNLFSNFVVIG